mmetsp:Transcript_18296/g.40514  ORF Transcript_18296/g.40514 Transcript_18296/m.40514 type:complete len:201 (-) Transcript_18296:106-708(-)
MKGKNGCMAWCGATSAVLIWVHFKTRSQMSSSGIVQLSHRNSCFTTSADNSTKVVARQIRWSPERIFAQHLSAKPSRWNFIAASRMANIISKLSVCCSSTPAQRSTSLTTSYLLAASNTSNTLSDTMEISQQYMYRRRISKTPSSMSETSTRPVVPSLMLLLSIAANGSDERDRMILWHLNRLVPCTTNSTSEYRSLLKK